MPAPIKWLPKDEHTDRAAKAQVYKILKGNVSIGDGTNPDNISGVWANVVTPGVADTEFSITHNANVIPVGYLVVKRNKAAVVYDGVSAWTTTQIFLKCNVATVSIRVFILT